DLVEMSLRIVKEEKMKEVEGKATEEANKRIVKLLVPEMKKEKSVKNPFEMLFPNVDEDEDDSDKQEQDEGIADKRENISKLLEMGELEDKVVQVEIEEQAPSMFDMLQGSGMEQMGINMQDAFSQLMTSKKKKRKLTFKEPSRVSIQTEIKKLINIDEAQQESVYRAEKTGKIFIDEIDRVVGKGQASGNVSREGVQRDILPIVEGSTVMTKYGAVKT